MGRHDRRWRGREPDHHRKHRKPSIPTPEARAAHERDAARPWYDWWAGLPPEQRAAEQVELRERLRNKPRARAAPAVTHRDHKPTTTVVGLLMSFAFVASAFAGAGATPVETDAGFDATAAVSLYNEGLEAVSLQTGGDYENGDEWDDCDDYEDDWYDEDECGWEENGDHKVTVCHYPASGEPHTLEIDEHALDAHLAHGDTVGACEDGPPLGSITVCKILHDAEGEPIDGTDYNVTFRVGPATSATGPAPAGAIGTTTWMTPLVFNESILDREDAACETYDGLELGGYYYGEESITGPDAELFLDPLYGDGFTSEVDGIEDLGDYSGEFFDGDGSNDGDRDVDRDGHIVLTKDRPDRTLVVLNRLAPEPEPEPGSITVCKILHDAEGEPINGTGFDVSFSIGPARSSTGPAPAGAIGTTTWTPLLVFNESILDRGDAECVTYDELPLGGYYYGEESITGPDAERFLDPLYGDGFTGEVDGLEDLGDYSGEFFDDNATNDGDRDVDRDGHIVLTRDRPHRTLVVLNQLAPEPILGSITVCKVIHDAEGEAIDGSGYNVTFRVGPAKSPTGPDPAGSIGTTEWRPPLVFNATVLGEGRDAECVKYDELELGGYYYGEESITGPDAELFLDPLYGDGFTGEVDGLEDLGAYSGEFFDDNATNDGDRDVDRDGHIVLTEERPNRTLVILNRVAPLGSITVCKVIHDEEGEPFDGSGFNVTFRVGPATSPTGPAPAGTLGTTTWHPPLVFNAAIFGEGRDAECVTYDELPLGGYYYGEESITGPDAERFLVPLYGDGFTGEVDGIEDLGLYSGEFFDDNATNDGDRDVDRDGHIVLTEKRPDRTLVILNRVQPIENAPPVARFEFDCVGLDCDFDGSPSFDPDGTVVDHDWDLGDGNDTTGEKPSHTYGDDGTYGVDLTVTDDQGATGSTSYELDLMGGTDGNLPPTALFEWDCVGYACSFDGTKSSDPDGTIVSYAWDFGGVGSDTGVTADFVFPGDGTYLVVLRVVDDDGAAGSRGRYVEVADGNQENEPPTASFTVSCAALSCSFDGSASSDPDGTIVSYAWDFEAGTGSGDTPSFAFPAAGDYLVVLTVTDDDGALGSQARIVTVSSGGGGGGGGSGGGVGDPPDDPPPPPPSGPPPPPLSLAPNTGPPGPPGPGGDPALDGTSDGLFGPDGDGDGEGDDGTDDEQFDEFDPQTDANKGTGKGKKSDAEEGDAGTTGHSSGPFDADEF